MSYGVLAAALPAATVTALGSYAQGITASEVYVQDRRPTVPADTAYAWWRLDDDDEVQALGQIVTRLEFELRLVYQDGTRGNLETWRAAIRQAFHGARIPAISGLIAVEVGSVTSEDDEELEGDVEIVVPVSFVIDLLPPLLPPEDLAASDNLDGTADLTWTAPQLVDDLVTFVLRRAAGATAPASAAAGDGVTLGGALDTSVTDSPGSGQFSYALFAGYDTTGDGAADTYSLADTFTVTLAAVLPTTGLAADLDGNAGVTTPGGAVSAWADQVGDYDLAQASGALQPTSVEDAIGSSLDVVSFDGTESIRGVGSTFDFSAGGTLAVILKVDALTERCFANLEDDTNSDAIWTFVNSSGQVYVGHTSTGVGGGSGNGTATTAAAPIVAGEWNLVLIFWTSAGVLQAQLNDESGQRSGTAAAAAGLLSVLDALGLGAQTAVSATANAFAGDVARALVYEVDLRDSADDLAELIAYSQQNYGTP